jgi:hypothetical protein
MKNILLACGVWHCGGSHSLDGWTQRECCDFILHNIHPPVIDVHQFRLPYEVDGGWMTPVSGLDFSCVIG